MKAEHTRKLIGGAVAIFGLWWTCEIAYPLIRKLFHNEIKISNVIFMLTIMPLMISPGILALFFGVRLFRKMSESALKWVVGVVAVLLAIFLAFFLSSQLSQNFPSVLPEKLWESTLLFMSSLFAIFAYLFIVRFLLQHLSNESRSAISLLSRGVVILMAWQLWMLLLKFFEEYSPIKDGYTHVPEEPWGILGFVVPIFVAYGSYRIIVAKLNKAQQAAIIASHQQPSPDDSL
jgi:hypothetical protein